MIKSITLINDCKDDNAKGRQTIRWATLFPTVHISFIGIDSSLGISSTLEGAGNLIDAIDATENNPSIVALNVAPRGQIKEDGKNGSRFCYFTYKRTLVISTIKGYNLSLVKKLNLTNSINILNTEEVLRFAETNKLISSQERKRIFESQFRSFDFVPRVARWITDGYNVPNNEVGIEIVADVPNTVWLIDSFGNIKTTLTENDLPFRFKEKLLKLKTNIGNYFCYSRLKDVPAGETAIYIGSSGIKENRFVELATQNTVGSIKSKIDIQIGDKIEIV